MNTKRKILVVLLIAASLSMLVATNLVFQMSRIWNQAGSDTLLDDVYVGDADVDGRVESISVGTHWSPAMLWRAHSRIYSYVGGAWRWEGGRNWIAGGGDTYLEGVKAGDIDYDGKGEIVTCGWYVNATTGMPWMQLKAFTKPRGYAKPAPEAEYHSNEDFPGIRLHDIELGDVDRDGTVEEVVVGDVWFSPPPPPIYMSPVVKVYHKSNPTFTWEGTFVEIEKNGTFWGVDIYELDYDGRFEIVAVGEVHGPGPVKYGLICIYEFNGTSWVREGQWDMEDLEGGNLTWYDVEANDLDDDGTIEFVVVGYASYPYPGPPRWGVYAVYQWNGAVLTMEDWGYAPWLDSVYRGVVTGGLKPNAGIPDIDRDGRTEFAVVGWVFNSTVGVDYGLLAVYRWNPSSPPSILESSNIWGVPSGNTRCYAVGFGDIDRDGLWELVTAGHYWNGAVWTAEVRVYNT